MTFAHPVVHFEMPYQDAARVAGFYERAFGWSMHTLGAEMGDYVTAQTTQTDEHDLPATPGAINGGFFPRSPDGPQHPNVVIAVSDIGATMAGVSEAGGTLLEGPIEIPGIGHYASFLDTEGNRVSLLQPMQG